MSTLTNYLIINHDERNAQELHQASSYTCCSAVLSDRHTLLLRI